MRSFSSLSLATLAALAVSNAQPYNGFWKTCYYPVYIAETNPTDTLLDVICQFDTGQWTESQIYLSSCITNDGGTLVYDETNFDSGYFNSCTNCTFEYQTQDPGLSGGNNFPANYTCECKNWDGNYQFTRIDLNNFIGNINGALVC